MRNARYFLLALVPISCPACARQPSVPFIGNSWTHVNDLPDMVRQLALSLGEGVTVASYPPGVYTLFQHSTDMHTLTAIA